jgi:hypothetical protein
MAGCASCGGCCAGCAASCGGFSGGLGGLYLGGWGGGGLAPGLDGEDGIHDDSGGGGYGSFGGFQFHPWFGSHRKKDKDASATTVDTKALVDPNHPGHRGAIQAISHTDPEQHSKLMGWLKKELDQSPQ